MCALREGVREGGRGGEEDMDRKSWRCSGVISDGLEGSDIPTIRQSQQNMWATWPTLTLAVRSFLLPPLFFTFLLHSPLFSPQQSF